MVALRSTKQDRTLLVAVWALTAVVLALGIATLSPLLLLWGALGLPGAIFLTRIYLRDARRTTAGPVDNTEPPGADDGTDVESKESPR